MRVKASLNGITAKAYSGTTGILLAFDIENKLKKNFLGFAVRRTDSKKTAWLQGALKFPGTSSADEYALIDSNLAPIQKFRWSDYSVYEGGTYTYEVFAVHRAKGKAFATVQTTGPTLTLKTQSSRDQQHEVVFNRAVAASQAYEKKFGDTKPNDTADPRHIAARQWLSRGIKEKLLNFLQRANGKDFSLDVAIYEFEVVEVAEVLNKVAETGAKVRLMYHFKKNDPQTHENEERIHLLSKKIEVVPRVTHKIFHHKFAVLKKDGKPVSALSGSTNFTDNAFYLQANVVHVVNDPAFAQRFADLFETLLLDIADKTKIKDYNSQDTQIAAKNGTQFFFSPRRKPTDLERLVNLIQNAKQNFILCSAFDIHPSIETAILQSDKIKYGLQNSKSQLTGMHRNQNFTVPDFLRGPVEQAFKEESTKRRGKEGSIYIHLKTMVIDFASDSPTVVYGSHNFSQSASLGNDENLTIIEGNTDVADVYMIEMFRLYDHYRFRYNTNVKKKRQQEMLAQLKKEQQSGDVAVAAAATAQMEALKQQIAKPLALDTSDAWTADYFDPHDSKYSERKLFI